MHVNYLETLQQLVATLVKLLIGPDSKGW